jgi:membrane-associated protein
MEFLQQLLQCPECDALHLFLKLINPSTIIALGGLYMLIAVVFAETGLLVGFFLPGDSLLFITGLFASKCRTAFQYHHLVGEELKGICGVCADTWIAQTPVVCDFTGLNPEYGLYQILIFVSLAAILGDSLGYFVGVKAGNTLYTRQDSIFFKKKYLDHTQKFYERHGGKAIVLGRFLPIIRTFAPVVAGVVKLEYRKFIWYNITGGVLWVFSMVLSGYFLGQLIPGIEKYLEFIVIGIVLASTFPVVRTYLQERALAKKLADLEAKGKIRE